MIQLFEISIENGSKMIPVYSFGDSTIAAESNMVEKSEVQSSFDTRTHFARSCVNWCLYFIAIRDSETNEHTGPQLLVLTFNNPIVKLTMIPFLGSLICGTPEHKFIRNLITFGNN